MRLSFATLSAVVTSLLLGAGGALAAEAPRTAKVLRVTFAGSESGFDPAQISDVVSAAIVSSVSGAPLTYDYLARPVRLKPNTAAAMPEVNEDHTRFVFRLKPGIFFSDDPAFKGARRELVAADYVYSIKRYYDPQMRSPSLSQYQNAGLLGLSELRQKALDNKTPFDYDTEVAGLRVLDRYRFELRVARPAPRLPYVLATPGLAGAVAREVIEANPGRSMQHPVGTGPFRLAAWRRSSRIVLERNPEHRHSVHDEQPAAGDARGQALADAMRGRALPLLDRVEVAIIEETQPRWLAFLQGELDLTACPPNTSTRRRPKASWRPTSPSAACRSARPSTRPRAMSTSAWSTPWSAATRPRRWRCVARWHWPTTPSARSNCCVTARCCRRKACCRPWSAATTPLSSPR